MEETISAVKIAMRLVDISKCRNMFSHIFDDASN